MKYILKILNRTLPLILLLIGTPILLLMVIVSNIATLIWHFKFYWSDEFTEMIEGGFDILRFKIRLWKPIEIKP